MLIRFARCSPVLALLAMALPAQAQAAAPAGPAVFQQEERRQSERGQDRRDTGRQEERRGTVQEERRDTPPPDDRRPAPQEYRVKNILGTKVSIQGDISIGTVDDIVFSDEGYVEYLIINNDGQLRTVPWTAAKFNFERRTASLSITQTQFQTIPSYTPERYPTFFAPTYRQETYRFFGLTPREIRRMDRR